MNHWRTTLSGALTIVCATLSLIVIPIIDGNSATSPDIATFVPLFTAGLMGLLGADARRSKSARSTDR